MTEKFYKDGTKCAQWYFDDLSVFFLVYDFSSTIWAIIWSLVIEVLRDTGTGAAFGSRVCLINLLMRVAEFLRDTGIGAMLGSGFVLSVF